MILYTKNSIIWTFVVTEWEFVWRSVVQYVVKRDVPEYEYLRASYVGNWIMVRETRTNIQEVFDKIGNKDESAYFHVDLSSYHLTIYMHIGVQGCSIIDLNLPFFHICLRKYCIERVYTHLHRLFGNIHYEFFSLYLNAAKTSNVFSENLLCAQNGFCRYALHIFKRKNI